MENIKCKGQSFPMPLQMSNRQQEVKVGMRDFMSVLSEQGPLFQSVVHSSIISLGVRIAPGVTREEHDASVEELFVKEFSAAIFPHEPVRFNYRTIFDPEFHDEPFSDRLPSNPETAAATYRDFLHVKEALRNKILFPDTGQKSVGAKVSEIFWSQYNAIAATWKHDRESTEWVSPLDQEKLYEQTGYWCEGPVEMRAALKYNDLVSRVYYARGGSVLRTSRYVQKVFNTMVDCFPEVHRYCF